MKLRSSRMRVPLCLIVLALLSLAGCRSGPPGDGGSQAPPAGTSRLSKVRALDATGTVLFVLDPSEKGYHVRSADGRDLGSVKVEADRVKVSDSVGKAVYKVKQKEDGFKVYREPEKAGGEDVLRAELKLSGKNFRLKDAQDRTVYQGDSAGTAISGLEGRQLRAREDKGGVAVEDPSGQSLGRVEGLRFIPAAVFCVDPNPDTLEKAAVAAYSARLQP